MLDTISRRRKDDEPHTTNSGGRRLPLRSTHRTMHLTEGVLAAAALFIISQCVVRVDSWVPDVQSKIRIPYDATVPSFFGNSTDYFKLLDANEQYILIGARNAVYNISIDRLVELPGQRISWPSSDAHRELCTLKGKHEQDCQNYIRVFARINANRIMVCGTNSFKPLCRYYNVLPGNGSLVYDNNELEAQGRCPYNPQHNSTYVYTDGQLYSATVADFSGADALIYREPQRTEQFDSKQLNQPAFVSAIEYNGYVMFFYREVAMEYMNCGKAIYSRVSRVCKNDKGGPYPFQDKWTSFLKARLNCSIPGEYPFYFDELQATTNAISGTYGGVRNKIIYGIMTTPENAIGGSAVCAFSVEDIMEAFEGPFKAQRDIHSNWLQVPPSAVPEPRPGKCVDDSRTLPKALVNFVKTNNLMDSSVPSVHSRPVFTRVSLYYRLSAIAVDPQVKALDGQRYDVIFVGTNDGKVIKFVNILSANTSDDVRTVVISETQAFPPGTKINEMTISKKNAALIVISSGKIISLPLHTCNEHSFKTCRKCLDLQDPYCAWDDLNRDCKPIDEVHASGAPIDQFYQRLDGERIGEICRKYDHQEPTVHTYEDNDVYTRVDGSGAVEKPDKSFDQRNVLIVHANHGTVSSVGPEDIDNEISMSSMEGDEQTNRIINTLQYQPKPDTFVKQNVLSATPNLISLLLGFIVTVMVSVGVGCLFMRHLMLKKGQGGCEHRNQLHWQSGKSLSMLSQTRTSGKDVNLLMNTTNQYHTQQQAIVQQLQQHHQNNCKDNIDFDYKDRSVECKNSTENLEKDISKGMGTLQKTRHLKTFKP
ncbi:semaphorin-1A isoform X1 [Anopheles merus]|uniref:semaphorin-1A isoform X1 n=1 Tax=Anopheles merus TaxID=30066 RepID=UPI001BE4D20A|nr:semaphorin-1A isoform X1 [Anopheles merus]XP_041767963.1 semaphorin-1A isoform X1 [Anopheles merus]XP_041767964.1 semaphorin-1A isoform X1 [Anopheles merus]XP_041767965.1 semaphorin-1A isoform X1 [Anopheles merus]